MQGFLQLLKIRKLSNKYDPINLFLETYSYVWFEKEASTDTKTKSDAKVNQQNLKFCVLIYNKNEVISTKYKHGKDIH